MAEVRLDYDNSAVIDGQRAIMRPVDDPRVITWNKGFGADMCLERGADWLLSELHLFPTEW